MDTLLTQENQMGKYALNGTYSWLSLFISIILGKNLSWLYVPLPLLQKKEE